MPNTAAGPTSVPGLTTIHLISECVYSPNRSAESETAGRRVTDTHRKILVHLCLWHARTKLREVTKVVYPQSDRHAEPMRIAISIILLCIGALGQSTSGQAQDIVKTLLPNGNPQELVMPKPSERERVIRQLRAARADAQGVYAQQAAFLLAALGADYERSRDYLLWVLKGCDFPDIRRGCDDMTGEYLIYLCEHGHHEFLGPMLISSIDDYNAAGSEGLGSFFSTFVAKSPNDFLDAVRSFPASTQIKMCTFAGFGDGGGMAPEDLRKVRSQLGRMNDEVARRCLRQIEKANTPEQ